MINIIDIKIKKNYQWLVIIIVIIIFLVYLYYTGGGILFRLLTNNNNEKFYQFFKWKPHIGKDKLNLQYKLNKIIDKKHNSYTISGYIYITDWKYKFFQIKNLLDWKDTLMISLDKEVNNLIFSIKTDRKNKDKDLSILNVNINKWFHFAIVVQQLQVDLYYNGKLYNSSILESLPKYENDDIIICNDNGFAGLVYDFRIYYRPLVHSEIYTLSRSNPPISKKYFKDRY